LRKSRADLEAEAMGAGDTLKRHESALTELALARGLSVTHIYREIVSGDTISARPQMQQLLADVELRRWEGVLCMEVERLARGDTVDQGIVAQTFKFTGTLIITPQKIYDPNNDMDEEYFEFSLFMARREYKTIKRRLMAGRIASVREGNYMSPKPTYGYDRVRAEGRGARWKLVINPDEAAVVRSIYEWYEHGIEGREAGAQVICNRLNSMGLRTAEGKPFYPSGIRAILHNITYTGSLSWNKRVQDTTMSGGARVTRRVMNREPIIVTDTHEPIISAEQFNRVQQMLADRTHNSSVRSDRMPLNPFRGLIVCGVCGKRMQRKANTGPYLRDDTICCTTPGCPTCASQVRALETVLLNALRSITLYGDYIRIGQGGREHSGAVQQRHNVIVFPTTQATGDAPARQTDGDNVLDMREMLERRIEQLRRQRTRIQELLETEVYDVDTYVSRNADITSQIASAKAELEALRRPARSGYTARQVAAVTSMLSEYSTELPPEAKQRLLASTIDHVVYQRKMRAYRNGDITEGIMLEIFLREF
ncbi:MAG: recombinase family protein, partial [Candidatus Fimadaptatus sp.]